MNKNHALRSVHSGLVPRPPSRHQYAPSQQPIRPSFIRLPKPKTNCPYTGYSRTGLYNLCVPCKANGYGPAVPAKCERKSGNLSGVWLIPFEALIAHIENLPTPGMREDVDDREQ